MGKKNVGYSVEKPVVAGGKMFIGIVIVPHGWIPGDLFRALEELFGSQNDIHGLQKDANIVSFKNRVQNKYKDYRIVEGCKERLLGEEDVKWWSLDEMKHLMKEVNEKNSVSSSDKVIIVKNEITKDSNVKDSTAEETIPSNEKNHKENAEGGEDSETLEANDSVVKREDSEKHQQVNNNVEKDYEELQRMKRKVAKRDEQIIQLSEQLKEVEAGIQEEIENAKKVMVEKNGHIALLAKEIEDIESQVKQQKKINADLMNEKLDWNQNLEDEEGRDNFQETLDKEKDKTSEILKAKEVLEDKVDQIEKELEEKNKTLTEVQQQMKAISDNCSFLQTELVKQKAQLTDESNHEKSKQKELSKNLEDSKKELEDTNKELNEKAEEIKILKQKLADLQASSNDQKPNDEKLDEILSLLKGRPGPKEIEQTRRGQFSAHSSSSNIQVSRIRSKNGKMLLVGHPEVFRNMENIPSLKKNILDLIKSGHIEILTGDFEGFQLKNLLKKATDLLKKPSFSEVVQDSEKSKKEITTVVVFPGNHYEAKCYLEDNKGKSIYILETKLETSVGALKDDIVEILNAAVGKEREIVVVLDPASEATYKYSRKMKEVFDNSLASWKATMSEEELPKILVWDMAKEQMDAGMVQSDKRKCWDIREGGKSILLHREALTTDEARVSKKMMIKVFNKIVDHVAGSPAGAPVCKDCGIQQASSYIDRCVEMDVGDYKGCSACSKDTHDVSVCWARKYESDKVCRNRVCAKKGLKHSVFVHDLTDPKLQEEARVKLPHEITFWPKPRMKRPFYPANKEHNEGPPPKQRKDE